MGNFIRREILFATNFCNSKPSFVTKNVVCNYFSIANKILKFYAKISCNFFFYCFHVSKAILGERMKKGANHAKVKVLSKDYIFHVEIFYWFIMHFSHNFSN